MTQGQVYPAAEVDQYINHPGSDPEADISEGEALKQVAEAVDVLDVVRMGEGSGIVYAYGYRCAPDRLKVGMTETGDAKQRIFVQINTSTPDRPVLVLEIRTNHCRSLERAIHVLEHRGCKVEGAGAEWFKTTREEVIDIYQFIAKTS